MIGVVAHDAGGAEIISSYIRQNNLQCNYMLDGPARQIFSRKLGPIDTMPLEQLVASSERFFCGTSFSSEIEWRTMGLARDSGKHCVAFLDHWINYRQRFVREETWNFPDEVWVGDDIAAKLAAEVLPEVEIKTVSNAYFIDIRKELALMPARPREGKGAIRILFACAPVREGAQALYNDPRYWGYTEEDALRYFLSNTDCLGDRIEQIAIRPHPKEEPDKYDWAKSAFDLPIVTGSDDSLLAQVVDSDIVAGCATMAMVVGLLANKRVVCCIPPGGRTVPLPQPEIEKLETLIENRNV